MKFDSKSRRKSIKVWVSDEERCLLETKAEFYGYKTLASYVRDAVIYEKVTYSNLKNKNEIYEAYSNNTKELKKVAKEFRHLNKYATQLNNEDLKNISNMIYGIFKNQKKMLQLIDDKLNLDIWQEINKKGCEKIASN